MEISASSQSGASRPPQKWKRMVWKGHAPLSATLVTLLGAVPRSCPHGHPAEWGGGDVLRGSILSGLSVHARSRAPQRRPG
eukprot:scaffold1388_cov390-Prasinococcus_capsulatus_cf.AAC.35